MKQKIIVSTFFLIIFLNLIFSNNSFAISSSGGYTINSYDINMVVNENNTFDITETINVNFTGYGKHGIFRKLPLKNTVRRLDGTETNNRVKISNISVNDTYTSSKEGKYKVLKIGDKNQFASGNKTYIIKYNYNIGKDPLKNADELYFNLIGDEWDTRIGNVSFKITMPKNFDKTKLGFSAGAVGSTYNSNVVYNVKGNVISGYLKQGLTSGQALTIRLSLPEGYFVGASNNYDILAIIEILISIAFVIIAFCMWKKYGKDDAVVDTVEFYPPDGLNSADIGFIYKGNSEENDIISLLIYLANKGYLKIEDFEDTKLGVIKSNSYKIIKIKEYDGNDENERIFFNDLFKDSNEVTKDDLYDKFYLTLRKITKNINRKENQEKIFEKASLRKRIILIIMILIVFLFMGGSSILKLFNNMGSFVIFVSIVSIPLVYIYTSPNTAKMVFLSIVMILDIALYMWMVTYEFLGENFVKFIIESICIIALTIFLGIIKKRTEYGTKMLGRIRGFKNFLEVAEKPQLEKLVMKNPEYFYDILPYTYVLGVSNKWMKKFEDIALEAPSWYSGYTTFDNDSFDRFMNSTYSSISNAMISSPSSSSDGGSSGGGSSGGGSGGGGGGSW